MLNEPICHPKSARDDDRWREAYCESQTESFEEVTADPLGDPRYGTEEGLDVGLRDIARDEQLRLITGSSDTER